MENQCVSILMPVYNRQQYIGEAIDSVLRQTYPHWNLIIYDDGSTDKTVEIINSKLMHDSRVEVISGGGNKGVAHARSVLLKECQTFVALWMDSDDVMANDRIEQQLKYFTGNNIVFSGWFRFKNGQNPNNIISTRSSLMSDDKAFASTMFPVDKSIVFDESKVMGGEDWDWLKKMQLKYESFYFSSILYFIREHDERIGMWKRKIRAAYSPEVIGSMSYAELIALYKKEHGE